MSHSASAMEPAGDEQQYFRECLHAEVIGAEIADPGFARWIEAIPPKGLELLAKTRIPTFTRCPAHFSRFIPGKSFI